MRVGRRKFLAGLGAIGGLVAACGVKRASAAPAATKSAPVPRRPPDVAHRTAPVTAPHTKRIVVTSFGSGYTSPPRITVTGGSGARK